MRSFLGGRLSMLRSGLRIAGSGLRIAFYGLEIPGGGWVVVLLGLRIAFLGTGGKHRRIKTSEQRFEMNENRSGSSTIFLR